MAKTTNDLFREDLNKEINSLIDKFIKLKTNALKQGDWHMNSHYTAVLLGIKEVLEIYCDDNLAQLIYSDLIRLEEDELIINYPII
jgi:hypothetical protein